MNISEQLLIKREALKEISDKLIVECKPLNRK